MKADSSENNFALNKVRSTLKKVNELLTFPLRSLNNIQRETPLNSSYFKCHHQIAANRVPIFIC